MHEANQVIPAPYSTVGPAVSALLPLRGNTPLAAGVNKPRPITCIQNINLGYLIEQIVTPVSLKPHKRRPRRGDTAFRTRIKPAQELLKAGNFSL